MLQYLMEEMRKEAGLVDEAAVWRTRRPGGKMVPRQEPMMAMQAILGKLPVEAKKKIRIAEVDHEQNKMFVTIEGPWYGRKSFKAVVSMTEYPKDQAGYEHMEIDANLGPDLKVFSGKPAQYKQLGTQAGTWLRGVLLKSKRAQKKARR